MAAVPATITVDFTANYAGGHRVCWRIGSSGPYDCTTIVTCTGGGAACEATIGVSVDNESCDAVTFEGYVQAVCETEGSSSGRVPFSVVFTPNPDCMSFRVTCINAPVDSYAITNPGTGYDPLNLPVVSVTGGGGSGATAVPSIGNTINITNAGTLYTNGVYPNVSLVNGVGTGTGAQATITVAGGIVTGVVMTTTGTGYLPSNTFTVSAADIGGTGSGFAASFGTNYGTLISLNVGAAGSSYETIPTVTIAASPLGTNATATAILEPCPDQILGTACTGSTDTVTGLQVSQSFLACMTALPNPLDAQYTFVEEGCCYECVTATFDVDPASDSTEIFYTSCADQSSQSVVVAAGASSGPLCVVNNSWYWTPSDSVVTVDTTADCT